ncbi:tetratricopeptide repeat protein [Maribacter sp. 2308TA10-17]|uniref:tetratricopeptide repeat protein n=1 Tax=Maribacter sp. 2308TA10-17 TaxID=3386276 RepID=UPI0039BC96C2
MKTKLYFTAIMLLGSMAISNAQAQNTECMTNLSIYVEHAKVKNYDAAYTPWKMVYETCPGVNLANFTVGERILKDKIKKASGADKDGFIADLEQLYKNRMVHFPKKTKMADMMIKEVLLKYDNKMLSDDQIYTMLGKAYTEDRSNFKNPKALYLYFSSLVDLHKAGSKDLQEVFDVYDDVTVKIEEENGKLTDRISKLLPKEEAGTLTAKEKKRLSADTKNSKSFGQIAGSIDAKLGPLADCTNLIPLYQKTFDANKDNVVWVKRAVGLMFNKECTDDPMFKKLFEAQLALDPSADAYVYGGTLKSKAGDKKGAVADFDKALGLETDAKKRSKIAYKVATIYRRGSKGTARKYAQKAIDADPSNGKAYLLIANLYATSANQCGTTTFEKRAIYWKAADMARKAGRVDPSLSSRANKSAASYSAKAPTKEMIFTEGMAGKTVSFSCWVGGSVKVPSL